MGANSCVYFCNPEGFGRGVQLSKKSLIKTSALPGVPLKGVPSSASDLKNNFADILDLEVALSISKQVMSLQCSANRICMIFMASVATVSRNAAIASLTFAV